MTRRDPEAKKRQLLEGALTEFAEYGLAGARVDRIAKLAGCSAGLVYTYFDSKEELFDAVYELIVTETVTTIPITPEDLPGYAGRLFDGNEQYPTIARFVSWYQLERKFENSTARLVADANQANVDAIATAQAAGIVSDRFTAEHLFMLLITLVTMWTQPGRSVDPTAAPSQREDRRRTVVEAVRRLAQP